MERIIDNVQRWMQRWAPPGSRVLVATSGGPDSQVLLDVLCRLKRRLKLEIWALGVDHGTRPEALSELTLAAQLAARHGVPFGIRAVKLPTRGNILANARRARYDALRQHATQIDAQCVAIAHTQTDQAETVLLQMARGASLRGAAGMAPKRGIFVRPLLDVKREDIAAYVQKHQLVCANDPSNHDPRRARAKLRAETLGTLKELNPAFEAHLSQFGRFAASDDAYLQELADQQLANLAGTAGSVSASGLRNLPEPIARRVLRTWAQEQGVRLSQRDIITLLRGVRQNSLRTTMSGRQVRLEADRLWLERSPDAPRALPVPGRVPLPALGGAIISSLAPESEKIPNSNQGVAFDADRLHLGLVVRPWQQGDKLRPFGLDGHVKVGDLFTNNKIPRLLRNVWPVVVHGDEVVWVAGLRRGAFAPVTDQTRRVLALELERGGSDPLPGVLE